jgi:hypothetical protein
LPGGDDLEGATQFVDVDDTNHALCLPC